MRILIAGWQGQIARAFVEAAPRRAEITACAVGRPALDICEPRTIERALSDAGPDIVINAAAYTAVDKAETEPARAFALNRDGARLLALAAARRGVPIIHISTDQVFDGRKMAPYVETDDPAPLSIYGRSKLEGETAVQAANPMHIILRTAWVYSAVGRNFVKTILEQAQSRRHLRVVNDQRGNPTYAPHLVDAIIAVAVQLKGRDTADPRWGIYHATGTGGATWWDLASEALRKSAELKGPAATVDAIATADYPTTSQRPMNSELDCSKLEQAFGLRLPPWQEGVAACVERLLMPQDS
jgi:dTDP-4-dehydrorhamnose reductase